jgi:V/A-type H+-transporting ATPase subunit I
MIVPMEKIALILPPDEKRLALEALRDLGVVHIQYREGDPGPEQAAALTEESAVTELKERLKALKLSPGEVEGQGSDDEIQQRVVRAFAEIEETTGKLEMLEPILAELRPWGEFNPVLLKTLEARGVYVKPCVGTARDQAALVNSGYACVPLATTGPEKESKLFAVVSDQPFTGGGLPAADIPLDRPLSAYEAEAAALRERRDRAEETLAELKGLLHRFQELEALKQEETEFFSVQDAMLSCGRIAGVSGFVPRENLPEVIEAARRNNWALDHCPPAAEDTVPTLLRKPRWTKMLDPMMEFLSLLPGYREMDVSIPVLLFLTIFFGILIADAVYGALFLVIAVVVLLKKGKGNPVMQQACGLFILFSLSSLFWGVLTGNYGGYETIGLPYLTEGEDKENHLKLVCFGIGAFHLSIGHLLRIFEKRTFRNILAQIGWILVLFGNFTLIAFLLALLPGAFPKWLVWNYGVGLALLALGEIDIREVSTVLSCPLEVMNSFSDILSYIRLFAVCLAGLLLAKVFNEISFGMMTSVAGCIMGSILLLIGHLMNIALGALAILVHGVRLNTLEFSSHSQVRWGGSVFAPFRRKTTSKTP